jgi:hypothetical protein
MSALHDAHAEALHEMVGGPHPCRHLGEYPKCVSYHRIEADRFYATPAGQRIAAVVAAAEQSDASWAADVDLLPPTDAALRQAVRALGGKP